MRFRDNLEGLKVANQSLDTLKQCFEGMYNLDLQIEGEGKVWDSLQCTLSLCDEQPHPFISLCLADKSQKFTKEHQRLFRFRDKHCAKALRALKSLVPSRVKSAIYFRITPEDLSANVGLVVREMTRKGYASSHLNPQLSYRLQRWGVPQNMLKQHGL